MQRSILPAILIAISSSGAAWAQQPAGQAMPTTPPMVIVAPQPAPMQSQLGGGFIEFLFGDRAPQPQPLIAPQAMQPLAVQPQIIATPNQPPGEQPIYVSAMPPVDPMLEQQAANFQMDPRLLRQDVAYQSEEKPGTLVIDTPNHFLYLVEAGDRAMRYGIGVGRPGFTWSGDRVVSAKKEWPDWVPPKEMLERQPYLPHFMAGGPNNPLGARALYLGSTLYRIHGSNEPWTIGHNVSSGCIRMRNVDVIDLYNRVAVGTKVVVL
ncbi:MAG TPA: L,D-transpeptidase family protein [Pseudolabrys sp.]|nr:L,D-transpeptidase family protein [Pseudolabrys sp.]